MSYSHRSCHMSFIYDSAVRFDGPDRGVSRSPILPHGSSATSARSLPASRSTSPVAAPPTDEALQGNTLHGLPDCLRSAVPSYQKLVAARRSQDCGGQLSNSTGRVSGSAFRGERGREAQTAPSAVVGVDGVRHVRWCVDQIRWADLAPNTPRIYRVSSSDNAGRVTEVRKHAWDRRACRDWLALLARARPGSNVCLAPWQSHIDAIRSAARHFSSAPPHESEHAAAQRGPGCGTTQLVRRLHVWRPPRHSCARACAARLVEHR